MTCIVGLIDDKGTVWMGGDSAGVEGYYSMMIRADSKVFLNGEFAFGFTSSFRMGQLLRFKFTPPPVPEGKDPYAYMVTDFIEAVRLCLRTGGYLKKTDEREEGGRFLVGWRGAIYDIQEDHQVAMSSHRFMSVGSGHDLAKGALSALTAQTNMTPRNILVAALEIAQEFSAAVRGPFEIIQTPKRKEK